MSLINQMLQELDARGSQVASGGILQGQVRAVPERSNMRPVWWGAAVLLVVVCLAIAAWRWQARPAPAPVTVPVSVQAPSLSKPPKSLIQSPEFSLKIASDLNRVPLPDAVDATVRLQPVLEPANSMPTVIAATQESTRSAEQPVRPEPSTSPKKLQSDTSSANTMALKKNASEPTANSAVAPGAMPQPPAAAVAAMKNPSAEPKAAEASVPVSLQKQIKELTPQQQAENEFRRGATLAQQGKTADAIGALEHALQLDASHAGARQTLVALLIESKRQDEAMRRLREGLQLDPEQSGLAIILARLQVDRGELKAAVATLQASLPYAMERADYQAFLAALLQRESRHKEAIEHYGVALRKSPQNGVWWMGLGISLQAENRMAEASDAFARAKSSTSLSSELRAFVEEKLNSLQHKL